MAPLRSAFLRARKRRVDHQATNCTKRLSFIHTSLTRTRERTGARGNVKLRTIASCSSWLRGEISSSNPNEPTASASTRSAGSGGSSGSAARPRSTSAPSGPRARRSCARGVTRSVRVKFFRSRSDVSTPYITWNVQRSSERIAREPLAAFADRGSAKRSIETFDRRRQHQRVRCSHHRGRRSGDALAPVPMPTSAIATGIDERPAAEHVDRRLHVHAPRGCRRSAHRSMTPTRRAGSSPARRIPPCAAARPACRSCCRDAGEIVHQHDRGVTLVQDQFAPPRSPFSRRSPG